MAKGCMSDEGPCIVKVCIVKGVCMAGGMHGGGIHGKGGVHGRGACVVGGMHGRRDGHCSGRYASYWNAFLFFHCKN